MIKCIIFDFDLTLFDSSTLEELRDTKQWSKVYKKLTECSFYPNALNVISSLKESGVKIAIATNAPEKYVSKALQHNKIEVDLLLAYHDVQNHKPSPEIIYKILQKFSLSTKEVVYVGDNDIDYNTAKNANIKFFAVDWGVFSSNDIRYINFHNLISIVFEEKPSIEANTIIEKKLPISKEIDTYTPNDLILHDGNQYYLGYYKDSIKPLLIDFKNNKHDIVNKWNNVLLDNLPSLPKFDYIVRALGHKEIKIKETSLDITAKVIAEKLEIKYIPTLLYKNSESKKSVNLKAFERKKEIANKYSINTEHSEINNLKNNNNTILIIDDVLTTGATTSEIVRVLSLNFPSCKFYIFSLVQTRGFERTPSMIHHNSKLQQMLDLADSDIKKTPVEFSSKIYKSKIFSANYSHTNHNFIIQNILNYSIKSDPLKTKYLPAIYILRNILQRGKPTLMSKYLQTHLGSIHQNTDIFNKAYPLISSQSLNWSRIIKGDDSTNYYPAKKFYDEIIPRYFNNLAFIKNLLIPEISIFDITQVYIEELYEQQVDFYLPQASLIIEIDGSQHSTSKEKDAFRDSHTKKYGIETIRITTQEIEFENDSFIIKIEKIKSHIYQSMHTQVIRKDTSPMYIALSDYQTAYSIGVNFNLPIYKSTAIMRMQLLLLELIENDILNFNDDWFFEIKEHDVEKFAEIAIEDTLLWISHLMNLLEIDISKPNYHVTRIDQHSNFTSDNNIKIDFSLLQRYTDECQDNTHIIYVRTHYLDEYKYFEPSNAINLLNVEFKDHDYFSMSILDPIKYSLDLDGEGSDRISLLFLLGNIFLQDIENPDFREGQLGIITNALMQKDTVGLLPTGSGKSVCYQLAAILQPSISFVVCPIKSLMYDQKADLDSIYFSRTNYITSDLRADEKALVQKDFSHGKYFFIFISPERFQSKSFRKEFSSINQEKSFAYAVIDEVHCLSEWGHDFRTSYLNLANTIEKLAPESTYIGLTATASVNVLRDIQSEFHIENMDVKTPLNYTREELKFNVIDDNNSKFNTLKNQLQLLNNKWDIFNKNNTESHCGIIFTPHVNGDKGCYPLSNKITSELGINVQFYSGSVPKINRKAIMSPDEFDIYKRNVQNGFKKDDFTLLTATKAFGMGVNKGNIFYTIHYGLPSSMESLYQEAGRAGRNKEKFINTQAECLVLLTPEINENILASLWKPEASLEEIKKISSKTLRNGDINTNLFMFTNSLDSVNDEYKLIKKLYDLYYNEDQLSPIINSRQLGSNKSKTEKAIYRLSQLGIIEDWTIENFYNGTFEVLFNKHSHEQIAIFLTNTIHKYNDKFSLQELENDSYGNYTYIFSSKQNRSEIETYFLILLLWSYEHFAYNRRQSLKTVYDNCKNLSSGKITNIEFKQTLENYFKFNQSSYVLQHIADNPSDYKRWFEVFYIINDEGNLTNQLIDYEQQVLIKDQISRFLESYKLNAGLNFVSGISRLLLDDYSDSDGKNRLENSLGTIKSYEPNDIDSIMELIIALANHLNILQKSLLVESIDKIFNDETLLHTFYNFIQDEYSLAYLLEKQIKRFKGINSKLKFTSNQISQNDTWSEGLIKWADDAEKYTGWKNRRNNFKNKEQFINLTKLTIDINSQDMQEAEKIIDLPDEIGNLINLTELSLDYIYHLPDSISNLKHLTVLHLGGHLSMPNYLGKFDNLKDLSLFDIEDIPDSICNLTNLSSLEIWFYSCDYKISPLQQSWLEKLKNNGCRILIDCDLH